MSKLLKKDTFGQVSQVSHGARPSILRDASEARGLAAPLARLLLRREARALAAGAGIAGIPALLNHTRNTLEREYIAGEPMQVARPRDPRYFRLAMQLLRALHRKGIAHNDLAKEPNLLVTRAGAPAFIDFQLASHRPRRGKLFRLQAREDLRHLLKHKRTYCPEALSGREKAILSRRGPLSALWRVTGKPVYLFVTRRLLGWADREGAGDRNGRS